MPSAHSSESLPPLSSTDEPLAAYSKFKFSSECTAEYLKHLSEYAITDGVILEIRTGLHFLVELQSDLAIVASERCAYDDFGQKWKKLAPEERVNYYARAIKQTCNFANLKPYRGWCPDINETTYRDNDGQGFLDLLQKLMPDTVQTVSTNWIHVSQPDFDKAFDTATLLDTSCSCLYGPIALYSFHVSYRSLFITIALLATLDNFYGINMSFTSVKLQNGKAQQAFAAKLEGARRLQWEKDIQTIKSMDWTCTNCFKGQQTAGTTFLRCGPCHQIGRIVKYCSKDCQKEHWRAPPFPHKTECGKFLKDVMSPKSCPTPPPARFPPPSNGFKRSPSLLYQLSVLEHNRQWDYAFVLPSEVSVVGVMAGNKGVKVIFRAARMKAFDCGDAVSVAVLLKVLENFADKRPDYSRRHLIRQLEREYGVDVGSVDVTLDTTDAIAIEWADRAVLDIEEDQKFVVKQDR